MLLRTIELATARILHREPNIFVATGPSVFTDAFISEHAEHADGPRGGARPVYASRTSMRWGERLEFLQVFGALARAYGDRVQ